MGGGGGLGVTQVLSYQVMDLPQAGTLRVVRYPSANVRAFIDLTAATRSWSFTDC